MAAARAVSELEASEMAYDAARSNLMLPFFRALLSPFLVLSRRNHTNNFSYQPDGNYHLSGTGIMQPHQYFGVVIFAGDTEYALPALTVLHLCSAVVM